MHRYVCSIALVVLALSAGAASGAWSQALELASRGPRFIAAWTPAGKAVDVSNAVGLRRRVSLDLSEVTVDEALKEITRQADLEISYSKAMLPAGGSVSLHARGITVAAALTEVLLDAGVDVAVARGGHMALVKRPPGAPAVVPAVDTGAVVGQVTDKATGAPIVGATVIVEGTRYGAVTTRDGHYRIVDVPSGTYTLRARYIGYVPVGVSVTVVTGQELELNFALTTSVQLLDEVVTTGTMLPTAVKALPTPITVITADEIAARHPKTIGDLIRQSVPTAVVPELATQPIQTIASLRGSASFTSSQVKIFVDGVEASLFGAAPVDPSSIERIEVVRGPQAATIYGADAAAGVIQIFTKRGDPSLAHPRVDAQVALGVGETPYAGYGGVLRQEYTASVRGGAGDMNYNFGGGYTRLADWVPTGEASRQSAPSVFGGMRVARGILTADLSGRYYHNELPVVLNPLVFATGFTPLSQPLYLVQDWTNETYGTQITVAPTGWWRNQLTLGLDRVSTPTVQTQPRLTTPDDTLYTANRSDHRKISASYNGSVVRRLSTDVSGSFTAGIDHYHSEAHVASASRPATTVGTLATGSFASNTVTNTGYFGQAQVSFRDAVFLTAGLRADDNSAFGRALGTVVSPRIGLAAARQVGQVVIKVRSSYGRAIKAPLPAFNAEVVTPFSTQLANPLLRPERQRGWDAGIDLVVGHAAFSFTGYDQIADNLIRLAQVASASVPTFQYQNIGRVVNSGVELEGVVTFHPVQLKAQYGYVRSRIEDLGPNVAPGADLQVGDQPLNTPKHTAGAALTVVPRQSTTLTAGISYTGSFRSSDILGQFRCFAGTGPCPDSFLASGSTRDFIITYPGYAKVNVTLSQRITRYLEGYISIDNLTNSTAHATSNVDAVMGRLTMVGMHVSSR